MKTLSKFVKTAAVSALFASSALLPMNASAIEGLEDGTIRSFISSWDAVESKCARPAVTCISIEWAGPGGWWVIWKV